MRRTPADHTTLLKDEQEDGGMRTRSYDLRVNTLTVGCWVQMPAPGERICVNVGSTDSRFQLGPRVRSPRLSRRPIIRKGSRNPIDGFRGRD